jgi:hypothetical protein
VAALEPMRDHRCGPMRTTAPVSEPRLRGPMRDVRIQSVPDLLDLRSSPCYSILPSACLAGATLLFTVVADTSPLRATTGTAPCAGAIKTSSGIGVLGESL